MEDRIKAVLAQVAEGALPVDDALEQLRRSPAAPFVDTPNARVDTHRALRQGLPEVVFGLGKTAAQIAEVVEVLRSAGQNVLVTRVEAAIAEESKPMSEPSSYSSTIDETPSAEEEESLSSPSAVRSSCSSGLVMAVSTSSAAAPVQATRTVTKSSAKFGKNWTFSRSSAHTPLRIIIVMSRLQATRCCAKVPIRSDLCRKVIRTWSGLPGGNLTSPGTPRRPPGPRPRSVLSSRRRRPREHDVSELLIRPLTAADEAAWRRLWAGYLAFYETSVPEEVYRTTFARLLSGEPNEYHGLVAVKGGRPVGIAHYLFHRHCWRIENVCYLQDLYVDVDVRGTGAGRALIEAVYAAADAKGCPSVYWLTQHFNEAGRRLYDRIGELTPFIRYNW